MYLVTDVIWQETGERLWSCLLDGYIARGVTWNHTPGDQSDLCSNGTTLLGTHTIVDNWWWSDCKETPEFDPLFQRGVCISYSSPSLAKDLPTQGTSFTNMVWLNSSLPVQNGRHFANDIFRCILLNEKFNILSEISLKFVPIDNNPALV